MIRINIENLPKFLGIEYKLLRFKKIENYSFITPYNFIHLSFSNLNYSSQL